MSQYRQGTASVTQSSQTVTGTGTLWLANVTPGDGFTIAGSGVPYTVASVETDTSLTLSAPYAGATASGQVYTVWRDFTTNYSIPELSQGDIETATVWTRGVRKIDGSIVQAVTDHEAKADPHPQYLLDTRYEQDMLRESLLAEATLSLDFANNKYEVYEGPVNGLVDKSFGDVVTFTRASGASARNAIGGLTQVLTDQQRLVGNREGLLIEEARTRLNTIAAAPTAAENVTVAAVAHTISFFGTGTIDLTGAHVGQLVGTGAGDRVTLTFTPTAGTLTITPSGTVTDLQIEEGRFATSVIRGEGAQVTREADNCSRTLGAEFNENGGTMYCRFIVTGAPSVSTVFDLGNPSRLQVRVTSGMLSLVYVGGATLAPNFGAVTPGDVIKMAVSFNKATGQILASSSTGQSFNGSGYDSTPTQLVIGSRYTGQEKTKSLISAVKYIPRALSAAELEALTAPGA